MLSPGFYTGKIVWSLAMLMIIRTNEDSLGKVKSNQLPEPNRTEQKLLQPGQRKKEGRDQESIQSSTIPDPGYQWESDNFTIGLVTKVSVS